MEGLGLILSDSAGVQGHSGRIRHTGGVVDLSACGRVFRSPRGPYAKERSGLALTHWMFAIMAQDEIKPLTDQMLDRDIALCGQDAQRAG